LDSYKVFGGSSGKYFSERICRYLGITEGVCITEKFKDNNIFVKACETVRMKDVYLIQSIGLTPNDDFTEILFWMDAFKRASARSVTAVIPYFGYAKGDKKDEPRVSIRARVCAETIELAGADRVITMDLHSPQIQGFFKKPVDHITAIPMMAQYLKSLSLNNPVIVSPDAGFAKDARNYSTILNWPVAIGNKIRKDHGSDATILNLIGDVKDKTAVIVDDFTITGGTLINIAKKLKEEGAGRILVCLSHMLSDSNNLERLRKSPIESIVTTDSLYNPQISNDDFVKILSVSPFFAEVILRIQKSESVSEMFTKHHDQIIDFALNGYK